MGHSTANLVKSARSVFKEVTRASIWWGLVMMFLGLLAAFVPLAAGISTSLLVAWILVGSGFAYAAFAFADRKDGALIWRLLMGMVYISGGGYLTLDPKLGLQSLIVPVAVILTFESLLGIVTFFLLRIYPGSGWILFDAVLTLLLGCLIWLHWPASSAFVIGAILSINLIISGFTRLTRSMATGRTLEALGLKVENF